LTWNLYLGTRYRLSKKYFLAAGYRLLDIDYSRGTGVNKTALNLQIAGPALAFGFVW
jgi:hypothetical protein